MPVLRKDGPYIWVTWLNKLITGDQSCEMGLLVQDPVRFQ